MMKKRTILILSLILLTAIWFRFIGLGQASMGGDVMVFYNICKTGISPLELMHNSHAYISEVPPFWFATHNGFLQVLGMEVNFGTVRLLDAIAGLLTVLVVFGLGCRIGGRTFGLLAAAILAIHPIHIQMSRECYFYAPVVLGCSLMLWAIMMLSDFLQEKASPKAGFYALVFSGFLLTTYVTSASWMFAGIAGIAIYTLVLLPTFRKILSWKTLCILTAGLFLLSLPLLFSDWGVKLAYSQFAGERTLYWKDVFGGKNMGDEMTALVKVCKGFLFGSGWFRGSLGSVVLILACWRLVAFWKVERKLRLLIFCFGGTFAALLIAHTKSVHHVASRHFAPLIPFFVLIACTGFQQGVTLAVKLAKRITHRERLAWALCFVAVGVAFGQPALWALRTESGSPWIHISRWADRNLPSGTAILCDRWFTPWNELLVNPATNVHYTFTHPNEPPDVYMESRWRESVVTYLSKNPFAAYLDRKQFWNRLGPWQEPYARFSRKQEFVDDANNKLDRIALAYRAPPSDIRPEWQTLTIFYNTEEDVIERAEREGKNTLLAYGPDWGYLKPWRALPGGSEQLMQLLWIQTGAFLERGRGFGGVNEINRAPKPELIRYLNQGRWADYRTASTNSVLRVFNLTDRELTAELRVVAVALSGPISVQIGAATVAFPAMLMVERKIPLTLQPGEHPIRFALQPDQVLLVLSAEILPQ
jgi:hypothetical protein